MSGVDLVQFSLSMALLLAILGALKFLFDHSTNKFYRIIVVLIGSFLFLPFITLAWTTFWTLVEYLK